MKIMKIHFSFKDKLQGICMIYQKLTICIHIPNIKGVYDMIWMKARYSRVYMYIY